MLFFVRDAHWGPGILSLVLGVVLVAIVAGSSLIQDAQPVRIVPGDKLKLVTAGLQEYSGDFTVASDGTIQIPVAGSVKVVGMTIEEARVTVEVKVRQYVRRPVVSLVLTEQAERFVYMVGENIPTGPVTWRQGLTLRQLVSSVPNLAGLDTYDARLYRPGEPSRPIDLKELFTPGNEHLDAPLTPGDVVSFLPAADVPVWVLGQVKLPGEVRLRPGGTVSQAIAKAGGFEERSYLQQDMSVQYRTKGGSMTMSLSDALKRDDLVLSAGDSVTVLDPALVNVTVGGKVGNARLLNLREGATVGQAIEAAGGVQAEGSLERVLVFRNGEATQYDLRDLARGEAKVGPQVRPNDFIYVPENQRQIRVLGFVLRPGRFPMPDARDLRLDDALALAGGLNQRGTLRRAVVVRADSFGHLAGHRYDLDRYLRDGVGDQNPLLQPGDVVYFDKTQTTDWADLLRILQSVYFFDRLFD
ncbi:MAG: SLBB domain-containing protein [Fimbriimonadaceae bacterium]|nr:SLBB domain-containing protein [Fimbriimonadaceae bacterium]QYK56893.1 MAG: SLBB domain-containing protein [Fimbriimonadaceae bacterium]